MSDDLYAETIYGESTTEEEDGPTRDPEEPLGEFEVITEIVSLLENLSYNDKKRILTYVADKVKVYELVPKQGLLPSTWRF